MYKGTFSFVHVCIFICVCIYIYMKSFLPEQKCPSTIIHLCVVYSLLHHCVHTPYTPHTYTCVIASIYASFHRVPIYYVCTCSVYTPYKLDINHLQLLIHCPCRTIVAVGKPWPQGTEPPCQGGFGGPCSYVLYECFQIYLLFYLYICKFIYLYVLIYIYIYIYLFIYRYIFMSLQRQIYTYMHLSV